MTQDPMLFAFDAVKFLGGQIAGQLGLELTAHEERVFPDGELKLRSLVNVRGRDVYVIQSLYSDERQTVNDRLVGLLVFLGALRDASAGRIAAVLPYLAYARKDSRNQPRDPVTSRYAAELIEAAGADRVVTLDVHNRSAYHNAFRIPADHLVARQLFAAHFAAMLAPHDSVVVVSPDAGGLKRAAAFRDALATALGRALPLEFVEKMRDEGGVTAGRLHGDLDGATALVVDDMISTGGTLAVAAERAREQGARRVYAAASHGVFAGDAARVLAGRALDGIVVTDSIPHARLPDDFVKGRLTILSCAPLFAAAIHRLHTGGSIVEMNESGALSPGSTPDH